VILAWPIWPHVYTLAIVMIAGFFFRAETLPGAIAFLKSMAGMTAAAPTPYTIAWYPHARVCGSRSWRARFGSAPWVPALAAGLDDRRPGLALLNTAALMALLVLSIMSMAARTYNPFIYFRFLMKSWLLRPAVRHPDFAAVAANLAGVDGADPGAENRELAPVPPHRRVGDHAGGGRCRPRRPPGSTITFGFLDRSSCAGTARAGCFVLGVSPSAGGHQGRAWLGLFYGDDKSGRGLRQRRADDRRGAGNWRAAIVRGARLAARAPHRLCLHHRALSYRRHLRRRDAADADAASAPGRGWTSCSPGLQDTGLAVDVRPVEFEAKARERVYQQTDTHWNERGATRRVPGDHPGGCVHGCPRTPAAWTREDFTRCRSHGRRARSGRHDGIDAGAARSGHDAGAKAAQARAGARAGRPGRADRRGMTARHHDRRGVTSPRVIFRDSFHVAAGAVPVRAFQPGGIPLAERLRRPPSSRRNIRTWCIQEIVGRHLYNFIPIAGTGAPNVARRRTLSLREVREVAAPGLGQHLRAAAGVQAVLSQHLVAAKPRRFHTGGIFARRPAGRRCRRPSSRAVER